MFRPVLGAIMLVALAGGAAAQTLPPSIDPGRIQQQFQPPVAPPPVAPAPVIEQETPENRPPPGADKIQLTLDSIEIQDATVYTPADFAPLIAPYLHHAIALTDLFRLSDEITAKYRADGYILSQALVPAQRIGKAARLVVVEGFVAEVKFQGYESPMLAAYGKRIMAQKPVRTAELERYLLLANDLSGVQAKAVLSPAPNVRGGAILTVVTTHALTDALLAVDNRGSKFIGQIQLYAGAGLNIPQWDGRLAARFVTTPSVHELEYGELTYTQPLGASGLRMILYGNVSHSRPGYTLSQFHVFSDGDEASATLAYPLIRSRDHNLELRGMFDIKDAKTVVNNDPTTAPSSNDHLRILRVTALHDIADSWGGTNLAMLQLSRGLTAFGASADDGRQTPSRTGAQSDFTAWKGEISRLQDLSTLVHPGLALLLAAEGQKSDSGYLPAAEQFGLGGAQWGRAYTPSDVTADNGWAVKTELQYNPPIPGAASPYLDSAQLYTFYELGRATRNLSSTGTGRLSDAGVGVRFVLFHLNSDIQLAKPLSRDETVNYGQPGARPWRLFFSFSRQF